MDKNKQNDKVGVRAGELRGWLSWSLKQNG